MSSRGEFADGLGAGGVHGGQGDGQALGGSHGRPLDNPDLLSSHRQHGAADSPAAAQVPGGVGEGCPGGFFPAINAVTLRYKA